MTITKWVAAGAVAFLLIGSGHTAAWAAQIVYVGSGATPTATDQATINRVANVLGHTVTYRQATASSAADAVGQDAVIISSTVTSGDVAAKFRDVTAGVLTWEQAVWDDMLFSTTAGGTTATQTQITITQPGHPLAAGLPAGAQT